jgi:hypothetical protein
MAYDESDTIPMSEPATANATKFHLQDVPASQRRHEYEQGVNIGDRWKRFYGYNTGLWNGNWGDNEQLRKRDNRAMLDAIASQLGLSRHQRERARYLLHNFRFSKYSPYYSVLDISLIVCLLVANADFRGDGWVYYPTAVYNREKSAIEEETQKAPSEERIVFEEFHETFQRLIDSLGVQQRKLEKGIPKFRHILNRDRPDWNPRI